MWRLLAFSVAMVSMAMAKNVHWEEYKDKYDLSFEDHEDNERLKTFEANLEIINNHNIDADLGKHTYWLGVNKFAYMTNEEFRAQAIGGCLLNRNSTKFTADHVHEYDPKLTAPEEVDWRKQGYVTDVKNQAQCGSCWAFSTTGSLEGQWFKKTGDLVPLSEQQLVDCAKDCGNMGCMGGLMDQAFECIKKHGGIESEADYPYEGRDNKCKFDKSKVVATVTGYVDVKQGSEDALKKAVATVGPVSVAIDAGHISFQLYSHGVYKERRCSPTQLDHGVLAVGYGTEGGDDYWLVKNSWGPGWGLDGYIKMARNNKNMCGIATQASYPTV